MWAADRIEELVPYLRRFARASLGSTEAGDACVERVLQTVLRLSLEDELVGDFDRERVYQMLNAEIDRVSGSRAATARRALLLIAVERIPLESVRRIIGVTNAELEALISLAELDFAESMATNMLIIEDEPMISAQLKRIAESLGHKVIGIARRADEAIKLQQEHPVDIILCDIQLDDGSLGTDAITAMDLSDAVPVIFVTAYPEKYLSTMNEGPSYLITKPFDPEYLKAVIGHALINVQAS